MYNGSAEPVLVSASDLYSEDDKILVGDNRHFFLSCLHHLLTNFSTTALRERYVILV